MYGFSSSEKLNSQPLNERTAKWFLKAGIAKKGLGQGQGGNAVGDDFGGLGGDGLADDLAKLAKSALSGLGDGDIYVVKSFVADAP